MNDWLMIFVKIMMINIVLSGDNAVVIAMASRNLTEEQRIRSIRWGSFGAVALRLVLTVVAVYLLKVPYLQAIGSLLLFYIAVKLLTDHNDERTNVPEASTLWDAVRTIIVADFVMSLDNVLAIAAVANGEIVLTFIGISLSIPLIVWGSAMIMRLLDRFPLLVYIGAAILGFTAGEMIMNDRETGPYIAAMFHQADRIVPLAGAALVIAVALARTLLNRGTGERT